MKYFPKFGASLLLTLIPLQAQDAIESSDAFSPNIAKPEIIKVTNAVADWQIANPYERKDWDWTEGALWTGLFAHVQSTQEAKYLNYLKGVSEGLKYGLGPRLEFGDDHCVAQLHLWHYLRDELPQQLGPSEKVLNDFISRPHTEDLLWVNHIHLREWAWCDSLYMAPPSLAAMHAATGDIRYLDVMDELYWKTTDYLYNPEEQLFFRDSTYFKKKEKNGENVYWSRGNGWVFAGLCHILQHMPADYPSRPRYVKLFKEMAGKLKSLQLDDGSWHASLLDPDSFPAPETSGTAFFAYGFAWGVNNGILPKDPYLPAAQKAWDRLVKNVHADGKLGYIQPIGADPRQTTFDDSSVYGVGGFLQLGHELLKQLILQDAKVSTIKAKNPSHLVRLNTPVTLDWALVKSQLSGVTADNFAVRDQVRGYFLPSQVIDTDLDGTPDQAVFIADFTPAETRDFQLIQLGKTRPAKPLNPTTARFVPERKDDFAWENDRVAFRAYGPALAVEKARGGFDVWTKSVRTPIVDTWYRNDDYHSDNGTGLDGYKVGETLGCGGLGYLDSKGKLHTSPVFEKFEVIDQGPAVLRFKLTYPELEIDGAKIRETRVISMPLGTHAFEVQSSFEVEGDAKGIRPVAGLAKRTPKGRPSAFSGQLMGYWDPVMNQDGNGHIGTFLINNKDAKNGHVNQPDHLLKVLASDLSHPVTYHAGAMWSKVEQLDPESFNIHLNATADKILRPIEMIK